MKDLNNLKIGDIVVRYAPSCINLVRAEEDTVAKIGTKYIHLSMKEYGKSCPRKYNKNNGYIDYNGTSGMWKIFPGTLKEFNEWLGNSNCLIDSLKYELDTLKRPLTHIQYERIKQILMDA